MLKSLFIVVLPLLLLNNSCKGQRTIAQISDSTAHMELLLEDNYSGSELEETLVIKDQKALEQFFGIINRTRKPGLPIPQLDFSKEMLVVWCLGEGSYGSPKLSLRKETEDSLIISKNYPKSVKEGTALVSPFSIYKLPLSSKSIVFE